MHASCSKNYLAKALSYSVFKERVSELTYLVYSDIVVNDWIIIIRV